MMLTGMRSRGALRLSIVLLTVMVVGAFAPHRTMRMFQDKAPRTRPLATVQMKTGVATYTTKKHWYMPNHVCSAPLNLKRETKREMAKRIILTLFACIFVSNSSPHVAFGASTYTGMDQRDWSQLPSVVSWNSVRPNAQPTSHISADFQNQRLGALVVDALQHESAGSAVPVVLVSMATALIYSTYVHPSYVVPTATVAPANHASITGGSASEQVPASDPVSGAPNVVATEAARSIAEEPASVLDASISVHALRPLVTSSVSVDDERENGSTEEGVEVEGQGRLIADKDGLQ